MTPRPFGLDRPSVPVWAFWLMAFGVGLSCLDAAAQAPLRAVVTTNYVIVTNVVLVTNYVAEPTGPTPSPSVQRATVSVPSGALPDLRWVPPEDGFDWVQLKTGEWLKGRIKAMQERELEFYSEKLEDLTFDWKDVRQLRSPRSLSLLFTNGEQASGPIHITPDHVEVGGASPSEHPRERLQSLTPGGTRERDHWSGNASLGLTLRSGNTEQYEYNAQAHLQRRTPATRLSLDYIGNLSRVNGIESANNHRVNTELDLWLSKRFYLVLPTGEYYRDPFQNLAHRATAGVGVGYDLVDRPKVTWNVTAGPAYQHAWFESTLPGEDDQKSTAALWFGSRFEWDITRRIELIAEYRGQFTSRKVGETTHHSVTTLSLDITARIDLDVSFVWDRITQPNIGEDGVQPKPDDFRLILGVGLDF
jgi:YD repeat-containing protein